MGYIFVEGMSGFEVVGFYFGFGLFMGLIRLFFVFFY